MFWNCLGVKVSIYYRQMEGNRMTRDSSKWPVVTKCVTDASVSAVAKEKYGGDWSRKRHRRREVFDKNICSTCETTWETMTCGLLKAVGCYNRIALHQSQNASEDDLCCKPFECTCLLMLTQNVRGKKCGTFKVAQNLLLEFVAPYSLRKHAFFLTSHLSAAQESEDFEQFRKFHTFSIWYFESAHFRSNLTC